MPSPASQTRREWWPPAPQRIERRTLRNHLCAERTIDVSPAPGAKNRLWSGSGVADESVIQRGCAGTPLRTARIDVANAVRM